MSEQKWDNKGIVARKIICNSIIKDENDKYLTEKDVKSLLQQGGVGSQISDGRGTYTNNSTISRVANSSFIFSDKEEETISLKSMTISGDSSENGMFANSSIVSFVSDTPSLETANHMFEGSDIKSCTLYSDKLINAEAMFKNCDELEEAKMDFTSIQNGDSMFEGCSSISFDNLRLDNLQSGIDMFKDADLKENEIEVVINSLKNNKSLTTSVDMTIDKSVVKYFFEKTGYLLSSSNEYTDCYINDGHFRAKTTEDISSFEDFYPNCNYIEFDDTTNEMISYPTEIFNEIEDASGLFAKVTLNPAITSFTIPMPKVKKTNGMFHGNTAITTFNCDLRNVTEAEWMFYNATAFTTFTSYLQSLNDATNMFRKTPIATFNCTLGPLTIGKNMFESCTKLTSFTGNLSRLIDGESMFANCSLLATFAPTSLKDLENSYQMFYYCNKITSFTYETPKLKAADYMFYSGGSGTLATFKGDLQSLESGEYMFSSQAKLATFTLTGDMPKLTNGKSMFTSNILTSFTYSIPSLKNGYSMFSGSSKIKSFPNLKLENLEDGRYMFSNCTSLTTLSTELNLSKLKNAEEMFTGCKLNAVDVKRIHDTLPQRDYMGDYSYDGCSSYREGGDGAISIGINSAYSSTASTNLSRLNTFATNAGFSDWASMKQSFANKNWNVKWFYAGTSTLIEV